jgi:hypothetical protein
MGGLRAIMQYEEAFCAMTPKQTLNFHNNTKATTSTQRQHHLSTNTRLRYDRHLTSQRYRSMFPKPPTSLLEIPRELRFRIMEELILDEGCPHRHYGDPGPSHTHKCHPLFLTCRTLSPEYRIAQREHAMHVMNLVLNSNKDIKASVSKFGLVYVDNKISLPDQVRFMKAIATIMNMSYSRWTKEGFNKELSSLRSAFASKFPRVCEIPVELRLKLNSIVLSSISIVVHLVGTNLS